MTTNTTGNPTKRSGSVTDSNGVVILRKKDLTFDQVIKETGFDYDDLVVMCSTLASMVDHYSKGVFTPEEFQAMISVLKR